MKRVNVVLFIAFALLVTTSFAARTVKSKKGDIDLAFERGGSAIVCTAGFYDELTVIKEADMDVLVRGSCGQGWVDKSKVEQVAKPAGDKSISFNEYSIQGWIDNLSLIDVFSDNVEDFDGVKIDRDFKEYLTQTLDREQMEMSRGEN